MRKESQVVSHWHTTVEDFSTSSLEFYGLVKAGIERRQIPDLKISTVEWQEGGIGSGMRVYLRVSREHLNFDICAAPFGTGYFFSWWLARIPLVLLDLLFILFALSLLSLPWMGGLFLGSLFGEGQEGLGCIGIVFGMVLGPVLFLTVPFALGLFVRHGNQGLEPTVLSMPVTGFLYAFVFRPVTYFAEDTAAMFREAVHAAVLEAIDGLLTAKGLRALGPDARRPTMQNLVK